MSDAPLEHGEFKRGPGGRPTREEAERRHRTLLTTAFRLFLEKGWDGVSVDEISRQSGVAKGFIYARYADKGALFVEAIERLMADAVARCTSPSRRPMISSKDCLRSGASCSTSCSLPRHWRSIASSWPRPAVFPSSPSCSSSATGCSTW